jgi:hypothetical protein
MQVELETKETEERDVQSMCIRDNDLEVLKALRSNQGHVAFQGLRRQMNMHQEKLSRALQRLEADGLVVHTPKGYSLSVRGLSITRNVLLVPPKIYTTILQSMLPGNMSPVELSRHIEGRWFGDLRWLGSKEEGDELVLKWMLGDQGTEVLLKLRWGQLIVETDASEEGALNLAFIAAHRILHFILQPFKDGFGPGAEVKLIGRTERTFAG